ncbi:MAG TPA: type II toxin-antitoxin system VapC family toxin [Terracidiphilus sp.]|nr:type II toxin-antitoxin system VapC family toxin [Terracidiphilus sp.]
MVAADTNVWARAYLNDDETQARKARAAIETACLNERVFVPLIVLAELFWVLKGKWKKERVLTAIENLLETDGVVIESPSLAAKALEEARAGSAGFADLLIAQVSFAGGVREILTFDKAFGRQPQVRRLS